MVKLITIFIDGLKPDSVAYMRFLNRFSKSRIKTELGYSNTCHASMYTGVSPNKHLAWFIWRRDCQTSPFKFLHNAKKISLLNNIYIKYAIYKGVLLLKKGTVFGGFPYMSLQELMNWSSFNGEMIYCFTEPQEFINNYPTIFKIIRDTGRNADYKYCSNTAILKRTLNDITKTSTNGKDEFFFISIGKIDELSHKFGQDAQITLNYLNEIDKILNNFYDEFIELHEDLVFIVFSDHGHIPVNKCLDIYSAFKMHGKNLNNYLHFIDTNYARFWIRTEIEKEEIEDLLKDLKDYGFILSDSVLMKYRVNMPDNRYGDIIFYLDKPYLFQHRRIFFMSREKTTSAVSVHGLLPDYKESDGVFISNRHFISENFNIRLIDIPPTLIDLFNLKFPDYMDGVSLWKK